MTRASPRQGSTAVSAESAYLFRHVLLRDAAYELQLPQVRGGLHALALELLQALEQAGQLPREGVIELARHARMVCDWHTLAGRQQEAVAAGHVELALLRRCVDLHQACHEPQAVVKQLRAIADHPCSTPEQKFEAMLESGRSLLPLADLRTWEENLALATSLAEDDRLRAEVALARGTLHYARGDIAEALQFYRRGTELAASSGSRSAERRGLANVAMALQMLARYAESEAAYGEALARVELTNPAERSQLESNYGNLLIETGRPEPALAAYLRARDVARAAGNLPQEAISIANAAFALRDLGRRAEALDSFTAALAMHARAGNRRSHAVTLGNLGDTLLEWWNLNQAIDVLDRALAGHLECQNRRSEASTRSNIGATMMRMRRYAEAEPVLLLAADMHASMRNMPHLVITRTNLACLYRDTGRFDAALTLMNDNEQQAESLGLVAEHATLRLEYAVLHRICGEFEDAVRRLEALARADPGAGSSPRFLVESARLRLGRGDTSGAEGLLAKALSGAFRPEDDVRRLECLAVSAKVALAAGDVRRALEFLAEATRHPGPWPVLAESELLEVRTHVAQAAEAASALARLEELARLHPADFEVRRALSAAKR